MANNTTQDLSGVISYIELPRGLSIFRLVLQITIAVFGVVGNVIVIVKIIRGTNAFSVMTPYLLSLAFVDLGILLINYPLAIYRIEFNIHWILGKLVCCYISPFAETFFGACIWSIAAIAAERYVKVAWQITLPTSPHGRRLSKRIVFIVFSIWLMSFLIAALPAYLHTKYNNEFMECYLDYSSTSLRRFVVTLNAVCMFFLPMCIIAFSYRKISKLVGKRAVKLQGQTPNSSLETSRATVKRNTEAILVQTRKTQRILKPLVILFAVTMLPYQLFSMALVFWESFPNQNYFRILMVYVSIAVATNSAADPLVYCIMNREFRREIKTALPCCLRGRLSTWRRSFRGTFSSLRTSGKRSAGPVTTQTFTQTRYIADL